MRLAASYKLFLFTHLTSVQCHKYMGTVVPLVYHPYSPSPITHILLLPSVVLLFVLLWKYWSTCSEVLKYWQSSIGVLTKKYWSAGEGVLRYWRRSAEVLTKECWSTDEGVLRYWRRSAEVLTNRHSGGTETKLTHKILLCSNIFVYLCSQNCVRGLSFNLEDKNMVKKNIRVETLTLCL